MGAHAPAAEDGGTSGRRAHLAFALAAAAGLLLALGTALGPLKSASDTDIVARVGDGVVTRAAWDRAVAALAADNRDPVSAADRVRILDRLIDEEALVQRGLQLGLPESDLAVRKSLVDAMLQFAATDAAADREPSEAELRAFYDARPALFASEPELRVEAAMLPKGGDTAALGADLQRGVPLADGAPRYGGVTLPIPDALLSPTRLAATAGPLVRDIALGLSVGETGAAAAPGGGTVVVHVSERRPGVRRAPFAGVRDDVETAWRRARREVALARYLADLRRELRVTKTP